MIRTRNGRSEKHSLEKQHWIIRRISRYRLQRRLSEKFVWWKRLTGKVPSWEQPFRKMPSWTKHPVIIDSHTRLRHNTIPTTRGHIRSAYQDVRTHVSTLDWPSTMISATVFSLYFIFFALYIHWFKIFIQDLQWFAYHGVDSSSWSFGQIVAISVWAEPLCEYFHLELREFLKMS